VIADAANATIVARVALGPQAEGHNIVRGRIQDVLTSVDAEAFTMECPFGYGAVDTNCDVDSSLGFVKDTMNYGTDIPRLQGNHTRYLYGPGDILKAHSANEAITLGELEGSIEGYKKLILHAVQSEGKKRRK
jgi:acetylornithine deacetylase